MQINLKYSASCLLLDCCSTLVIRSQVFVMIKVHLYDIQKSNPVKHLSQFILYVIQLLFCLPHSFCFPHPAIIIYGTHTCMHEFSLTSMAILMYWNITILTFLNTYSFLVPLELLITIFNFLVKHSFLLLQLLTHPLSLLIFPIFFLFIRIPLIGLPLSLAFTSRVTHSYLWILT